MAQIGCYMTDEEIGELDAYASSIEITRAAVCALVVQRELRVRRLHRNSSRTYVGRGAHDGVMRRRVTVHIGNIALKSAFSNHARELGMGSDEATDALLRMELKERWLSRTFQFRES